MCGIAGICMRPGGGFDAAPAVQRMCDAMQARGPDAAGYWNHREGRVLFGHRRLAIIDPATRSNQPMASASGRLHIIFNGEIYNYRELRSDLERQGQRFSTEGDTEVILELIERDGIGAVERLRGMFAFALWDNRDSTLYLTRDPYGIKPLYVAENDKGLLFASQTKALLASGLVSDAIEPAGLVGFLLWGSVPEPWTLYRKVEPVPAGSWVSVRDGRRLETARYVDIARFWDDCASLDQPSLAAKVRESVTDSVRRHLVADVPVSVLLSGGVDSSAISAIATELGHSVEGITIGFQEFSGAASDETPRAKLVADHYGIKHTIRMVSREEFEDDLPRILKAMDQPSVDGVNTWFAAKAVAERGYKVVLSGIGGDELFCGYRTFNTVPQVARAGKILGGPALIRGLISAGLSLVGSAIGSPKLAEIPNVSGGYAAYFLNRCLFLPSELAGVVEPGLAAEGLERLGILKQFAKKSGKARVVCWTSFVAAAESTHYLRNQLLRDSDWASMAHSLELRTPLVDRHLTQSLAGYAKQFLDGAGKTLLASTPKRPLPASIEHAAKTGFGLPINEWIVRSSTANAWRSVASLRGRNVPWARRWAYLVAREFVGSDKNALHGLC